MTKKKQTEPTAEEPKKVKQRQHNNASYRREDLGLYVRSSWEANLARVFNAVGIKFSYEPKTYKFPQDHGNNRYTPDFKIESVPGMEFNKYIEVKGYMDDDSKIKLKRMEKYYPFDLFLILGLTAYREIEKACSFMCHDNWEYTTKGAVKYAEKAIAAGQSPVDAKTVIEIIEKHHAKEREKVYVKRARGKKEGCPSEGGAPESEDKGRNNAGNSAYVRRKRGFRGNTKGGAK